MSQVIPLTEANFHEEVELSPIPVLADFWADWCVPCKTVIAPAIADLARTYQGRVKVGTVDMDAQYGLSSRFGITSAPTLIVFKGGEALRKRVGAIPKHEIEALFKDLA